jgi:hypothetical protein
MPKKKNGSQPLKKPEKAPAASDPYLRDLAADALRKNARVEDPDRELSWCRLSADKTRIVVGTTDGDRAVFGVFGVTKTRELGPPQPFNFAAFELTWHGEKEHPTAEVTAADEAALMAYLEKDDA